MRQRLAAAPRALSGWLWLFQDLSDRLTTLDVLLHEIEDDTSETRRWRPRGMRWAVSPPGSIARRLELRALTPMVGGQLTGGDEIPTLATLPAAADLVARIERLERQLDTLIDETEFGFLFEPTRRLFSIGFNVTDGRLDQSHYDTLASEARLASFLAIATGQVPQDHWFRLGRAQAPAGTGRVLLSWSASMFEYLMPLLVMRSDPGTLIHETCQSVVQEQIDYAQALLGAVGHLGVGLQRARPGRATTSTRPLACPASGSSAVSATTSSSRRTRRCWPPRCGPARSSPTSTRSTAKGCGAAMATTTPSTTPGRGCPPAHAGRWSPR